MVESVTEVCLEQSVHDSYHGEKESGEGGGGVASVLSALHTLGFIQSTVGTGSTSEIGAGVVR